VRGQTPAALGRDEMMLEGERVHARECSGGWLLRGQRVYDPLGDLELIAEPDDLAGLPIG
jgi:hypothetical protein